MHRSVKVFCSLTLSTARAHGNDYGLRGSALEENAFANPLSVPPSSSNIDNQDPKCCHGGFRRLSQGKHHRSLMDEECVPCQDTNNAATPVDGADSADGSASDDVTQEKTDARKKRKRNQNESMNETAKGAEEEAEEEAVEQTEKRRADQKENRGRQEYHAGRYAKNKEEALWKEFIASESYYPGATPEDTKKAFTAFKEKKAAEKKKTPDQIAASRIEINARYRAKVKEEAEKKKDYFVAGFKKDHPDATPEETEKAKEAAEKEEASAQASKQDKKRIANGKNRAKIKEQVLRKEFVAEFNNPGASPEDTEEAFTAFKEDKKEKEEVEKKTRPAKIREKKRLYMANQRAAGKKEKKNFVAKYKIINPDATSEDTEKAFTEYKEEKMAAAILSNLKTQTP